MTHPLKWYPIHVGKEGKLRTYDGEEVRSCGGFIELIKETFRRYGLINGFKSLLFEKIFPLFAFSQLPKTTEFWRSRWNKMENEFKKVMKGKRKIGVVDIGCGSGDLLIKGAIYAKNRKITFKGIGIDIDEEAIRFAKGYSKILNFPDLEFYVGDAIKGIVENKTPLKSFLNKKLKGRPDLILVEGVIEWLRPFQDRLLKTLFSLNAREYIILAASRHALKSKGGRIISGIANLSGERVEGFTADEFKELLQKHAGKRKVSLEICGGEWYPEGFYVARIR
jgi:SAM-dependent methyltransferase